MTTYAVNHNMPGYLPESDGWEFDTYSDAVHGLVEEIERYYDDDDLNTPQRLAIEAALDGIRAALDGIPTDLGVTLEAFGHQTHFFLATVTT
jgi:hypothetical protein